MLGILENLQLTFLNIAGAAREADLSLSTVAAQTAALGATRITGSVYDVLSDVDCYIKVAETANDVTATTGYPILSGNVVPVWVPTGYKIGAITASGTGTLRIHRSR